MLFAGGGKVAVPERTTGTFRDTRMATCAVLGEHGLTATDGAGSELAFQVGDEVGATVGLATLAALADAGQGRVEVDLVRLGGSEEVEHVLQAILDRPEIRAVASALADVSRRHWPMSKGVCPKPRCSGSTWRMSAR